MTIQPGNKTSSTDIEKIKGRFDPRYEDAIGYINYTIKAGTRRGLTRLIYWNLPLIFLEGKIIAAFFSKPNSRIPYNDTITTIIPKTQSMTKEVKIFSYKNFINALKDEDCHGESDFTIERKVLDANRFDALDYFGFPCIKEKQPLPIEYRCQLFHLNYLNGKFKVWVAALNSEKNFFGYEYHTKKLQELIDRTSQTLKEEYEIKKEDIPYLEDNIHRLPHYIKGGGKLEVAKNDYYKTIFEALHEALLVDMGWDTNPNNIYIILSDSIYGHSMRFWLTEKQKDAYKTKFNTYWNNSENPIETKDSFMANANGYLASSKMNEFLKEAQDIVAGESNCGEFITALKEYLFKKENITADNILEKILDRLTDDHSDDLLESQPIRNSLEIKELYKVFIKNNKQIESTRIDRIYESYPNNKDKVIFEQSGTVSGIIKLRGQYDIFLYPDIHFDSYPILAKDKYIKRKIGESYKFSLALKYFEKYLLVEWLNRSDKSLAMIPFFIRGMPIGCIAFFIPQNKSKSYDKEQHWYIRLARALRRIESVEKHLEEAATKQVCRTILDVLEKESE